MADIDESSALLSSLARVAEREHIQDRAQHSFIQTSRPLSDHESALAKGPSRNSSVAIWLVVSTSLLGVFVANADGSLIVASNQQIASEFNALQNAQWLVTSYGLAQCATQQLYGRLSDIFGRRSNLVVAYSLFAIGCLVCGIGQSLSHVLLGRTISGIGGAGMTALVSVIITDMVPVRDVAAWRGYVNVAATTGRALGGPVGGWLCDTIGWRWCFYGQVPLTLLGLLLILWKLPCPSDQMSQKDKQTFMKRLRRIDGFGSFFLALAVTTFLLALDAVAKSSNPTWIWLQSAGCVMSSIGFLLTEKYWATEPVLPLRLLFNRAAFTSYLLCGFQIAGQFGVFYSTPLYYQIASGGTVAGAGTRLVPAVIGNASAGLLAGCMVSRQGRYKHLTVISSAIACVGYLLIMLRWRSSTNWSETLFIFFGGFGTGVVQSTTFVHLAAHLDSEDMAIAGTTLYLSQNVSLLVGIQSATTILQIHLHNTLTRNLRDIPNKKRIIKAALSNVGEIKRFPSQIRDIVAKAYIDGLTWTFGAALFYASLGLMTGLSMQESKLD